jgi:hypothetical protein
MTNQNYLMIQENVVSNVCVWDGDTNTWQPPSDATILIQADVPAMVWEEVIVDNVIVDYVLAEELGEAQIGYTWNGTVCTTNEPKPEIPVTIPA